MNPPRTARRLRRGRIGSVEGTGRETRGISTKKEAWLPRGAAEEGGNWEIEKRAAAGEAIFQGEAGRAFSQAPETVDGVVAVWKPLFLGLRIIHFHSQL